MRYLAILSILSLTLMGSSCKTTETTTTTSDSPAMMEKQIEPVVSTGMDNGVPYQLTVLNSCDSQTISFDEIKTRPDGQEGGIDGGIFFDATDESCAGIWSFDFIAGALLDNVDPDLGNRSFVLIRQEGDVINIAALKITTGWTITSQSGGTMGEWLTLPAVQAKTGDTVTITFTNADGSKEITTVIDLTKPGMATISA